MIQTLYQNLNSNIEKFLKKNQKIVVGVSGGQDSCVLLDLLLKSDLNLKIHVCHFNHMVREDSSDSDEGFVRNICIKSSIPFFTKKFDILRAARLLKLGVEVTGRSYRRKFFEEIAHKTSSSFILLGHHNNDQIETFLMRLIRGSSPKGLSSMSILDGIYLRPLLDVPKTEIEEYSRVNNISWVEDKTNSDETYTRNNIRKNLVPFFFKLNPNFDQTLKTNLHHISEQNTFIDNHIRSLEKKLLFYIDDNDFILPLKKFNKLSIFEKRELLFNFLSNKVGKETFVSFKNITDILSLASSKNASGKFFLTRQIEIQKGYDFLLIQLNESNNNQYDIDINSEGSWEDKDLIIEINKSEKTNTKFFNFSSKEINIKVRNFKNGDRIRIKNSYEKKLQDIFVDNKVPQFIRSKLPVFETNGEIFYVYGLNVDTAFFTDKINQNSIGITVYNKSLSKLIEAVNL
jgi:tRNA(Ile)-lysidine synthetase-like protein